MAGPVDLRYLANNLLRSFCATRDTAINGWPSGGVDRQSPASPTASRAQSMNRRDFIRAAGIAGSAITLNAGMAHHHRWRRTRKPAAGRNQSLPRIVARGRAQHYLSLEAEFNRPHPVATGTRGMVAGTSNPVAIHAGLVALKQGGTAADAALCTATHTGVPHVRRGHKLCRRNERVVLRICHWKSPGARCLLQHGEK